MIGGVWKGRDDHFLSLRPLSTRARKKGGGRWEGKAGRKFSRYTVYIEQATTFDEARRPTSARILAICAVHRPVPRQSRSVYVSHLPSNQTGHRLLRSNILLLFYSQNFSRKIPSSFIRFLSLYSVYRQGFSITGLHIKIMDLFIRTLFKKFLSRKEGYHLFHILFTDEISLRVIHKIRHEKIRSFLYFIYRQNFSCS